MSDNDVRHINAFPHAEISSSVNDSLVIHAVGINDDELSAVETHLIFSQLESVHAVQQKMDIENLSEDDDEQQLDELADKVEEEFEDDFDPMSI